MDPMGLVLCKQNTLVVFHGICFFLEVSGTLMSQIV